MALKSILRERLPPEAKGRATLELPEQSNLADIAERFDIRHRAIFTVNGKVEVDMARPLQEGDQVAVYVTSAGG